MFNPLEAILERFRDREDVCRAEQRLIEIRAGRTKTIPLEDVMKAQRLAD